MFDSAKPSPSWFAMSRQESLAESEESFDEAQDRQGAGRKEQGTGNLPGGGSFAIFFLSGVVEDT